MQTFVLSGTRDSRCDSRESIRARNPYFVAPQTDSPESLDFPIQANHPIRANGANFRFARITLLSFVPDHSSFPWFLWNSLFLAPQEILVFLSVFPLFSSDSRGSVGMEYPCSSSGFPCHFPKKTKEGQGCVRMVRCQNRSVPPPGPSCRVIRSILSSVCQAPELQLGAACCREPASVRAAIAAAPQTKKAQKGGSGKIYDFPSRGKLGVVSPHLPGEILRAALLNFSQF